MEQISISGRPVQPAAARIGAQIISWIFHPLFVPVYVTIFFVYLHPYAYAGYGDRQKLFTVLTVAFNIAFLSGFAVFLMRQLGLIQSMFLRTQRERIIPYTVAIIFYFWTWYVFHNQTDNSQFLVKFLLGAFLAVCGAWMFNIRFKISMHTTAMGAMLVFFLLFVFSDAYPSGMYIAVPFIVAGLVTTARLIVSDHSKVEIYAGLIVGAICQLVAWWV
ncbi:MAG: hypothetical protein QM731_19165 [Chitinophagaceae bacterium]